MPEGIKYEFSGVSWQYIGQGAWYFVSLPKEISTEIRSHFKTEEKGWGRLPVITKIGKTEWKTAVWFDTKKNSYILPLKAEVRKKERLEAGMQIGVIIWI